MSRIDDLIANYQRFAQLPWPSGLAPAQRIWMAVYSPEDERRLRLHLPGSRPHRRPQVTTGPGSTSRILLRSGWQPMSTATHTLRIRS